MNSNLDILTFGSVTLDIFLPLEEDDNVALNYTVAHKPILEVPLGEKIQSEEALMLCGGGAANSAVGFQKLGLSAAAIGVIGNDTNARFLKGELEHAEVNTDGLVTADDISSFSIILRVWDGKRTVFHHRTASSEFGAKTLKSAPKARGLYFGHISELSENVLWGIAAYREKNPAVVVGWNPGKIQFSKKFHYYEAIASDIDYLVLNVEEAEEFLGIAAGKIDFVETDSEVYGDLVQTYTAHWPKTVSDVRAHAQKFQAAGIKNVVITDGGQGAQFFGSDGKHLFVPSFAAERKDTLGAGDAFSIGLLGAKLHGKDLETQATWAAKNSGHVIQHYGAQAGQLRLEDLN